MFDKWEVKCATSTIAGRGYVRVSCGGVKGHGGGWGCAGGDGGIWGCDGGRAGGKRDEGYGRGVVVSGGGEGGE